MLYVMHVHALCNACTPCMCMLYVMHAHHACACCMQCMHKQASSDKINFLLFYSLFFQTDSALGYLASFIKIPMHSTLVQICTHMYSQITY